MPAKLLINEFRVEGNTVLPATSIEKVVMPWLGPERTQDDIYAARDALAKAYESAGYLSASVEAERIDPVDTEWGPGWVAVLKVVEGRVERLKVTGADYNLPSKLKLQAGSVAEGEVPHFPTMQEDLGRIARMADMAVTPLLRPGRDPGTMEVEFKVQDSLPFHAWTQLSNEQSPDTSPRRLEVGARYDNLFQAQHSLSARLITTPLKQEEIRVATLNYSLPVGVRDDKLSLYVLKSDSQVETNIGTGVTGKGITLGSRWTRTLEAEAPFFHSISLGADYKRLGEVSEETGSKPVSYLPFSLQYIAMRPDEGGNWQFSSSLVNSFGGVMDKRGECGGREDLDQFDCRRAGASSSFMLWNGALKRLERFGKWEAVGKFDWQVANGPLLSGDQFFVGGADSVRGYYQSEQGGDDGGRISLEIYTPALTLGEWATKFLTFYDQGWVRTQQVQSGQNPDYRLAAYGVGLRTNWGKSLSGQLDLARTTLPGSPTGSKDGATRLHATVRAEF
ncbi:ShlB/FhaC/HecB family hemolysin secretion/activation protein [Uliginosibacterium flavum]|uniref:ShlB/FhaC/HecB family hemolysin secretion/activation protein n=1 Tax=Uliginosibacterium flavum TaxID=1396831 RepID=UPI00339C6D2F